MKRLLILASMATLAVSAHAVNLITTNSDFETFNTSGADASGSGYWMLNNGNGSLSGWTIGGRGGDVSVDVVSDNYSHLDTYGIDLAGSPGPGSISRSIAITGGEWYKVSFWALAQDSINSKVIVELGGNSIETTIAIGATSSSGALVYHSFMMQAGGANTTFLMGTRLDNNTNGNMMIDNVTVEAVPEPFTMGLGLAAVGAFVRRRLKKS